jgi:diguanylate cyclase (GGDEF)-like protein
MAVAIRQVSRDTRPTVRDGMLVFGRYLDHDLIERLEQTSQAPVRATLLGEHGQPALSVPPAVAKWLASAAGSDLLVQTGDPSILGSHVLLRDIQGRPLLLLSTTVSRAALQVGKRTINWVVAALLVGFAFVVALLVSLLNRGWRIRAATQRQWLDQQRKLARLARRDALTGLSNRLHLQRLLPRLLARAARAKTRLALLYLDVDHFKNVNDSLGHGTGDRLLTAVARRLRASVAAHDIVVRMGGDEFVVLATELPNVLVANSIAERIRATLAVPVDIDGVALSVGYSSLSYLKHLPIDTLKIDRAFVRDMAADSNDAAIVRAIVGVAKSLGLMLVAEGIESEEQLDCLRKLGCECGQGFFVSPPVPPEVCRDMLRQLRSARPPMSESPRLRLVDPVG